MRRLLTIALVIVVFGYGAFQLRKGLAELLPVFGIGRDADVATAAENATKAAADFVGLNKDSATTGTIGRQTDPSTAAMLDTVFGIELVRTRNEFGSADLGSLAKWSSAANTIGIAYMLAGTGITDIAKLPYDLKAVARTNVNIADFAPEVGRYLDAEMVLFGAVADSITSDKSTTPAGIDKIRSGMTKSLSGVIEILDNRGLDGSWRQTRLTLLIATAPKVARLLIADQCNRLRATANAVAADLSDTSVKDQLEAFDAQLTC